MNATNNPLIAQVEEKVGSAPIVIFMKGTPDFPMCGFSARACQVLKAAGAKEILGVDVLADDPLWGALEDYTQWPTVPQIFIHGKFIGGCDIAVEMYEKGELQQMIQNS